MTHWLKADAKLKLDCHCNWGGISQDNPGSFGMFSLTGPDLNIWEKRAGETARFKLWELEGFVITVVEKYMAQLHIGFYWPFINLPFGIGKASILTLR